MYEDILNQAKEIWNIKEFTPAHSYSYMYMSVVMILLKKQIKTI